MAKKKSSGNLPAKTRHAEITTAAIASKRRVDGWTNIMTGMGLANKDARVSESAERKLLPENQIEHLYAADSQAAKIVDMIVDTAFEKGYEWTGISDEQIKTLKQRLDELRFDCAIKDALKRARLYGGAVIFKSYDDNLILDLPKNPANVVPIKALIVLQRFELFCTWEDVNKDILSPDFGKPRMYTFNGRNGEAAYLSNVRIHHSRVMRFDGNWLPDKLRHANQYWSDSVLSRPYDAIRNYAHAHDAVNAALKDLSVAVFKIKHLADMIGADADQKVLNRLQLVALTKSIIRAVAVDADGEDFEYKARNFTGAEKLVEQAEKRLASEAGIPHSVLFSDSPTGGGLASNGEHNSENWYNQVESYQCNEAKPKMLMLVKEICDELKIDHSKLDINFQPLWQMSEKETVEMRKAQAEVDKIYNELGVLDQTEIRESRFGSGKYSIETTLDKAMDAKLVEEAELGKEMQAEALKNKGKPGEQETPEEDPPKK
jgi:uncharacterized protein